jgi:WD40-like Beta Propeller Repeat
MNKIKFILLTLLIGYCGLIAKEAFAFTGNYISEPYAGEEAVLIINPVLSENGRYIAFEKNNGVDRAYLYLADLGRNPRNIFNQNTYEGNIFNNSGSNQIERLVTERLDRSADEFHIPLGYSFSPNSEKLVFGTISGTGQYKICIYDIAQKSIQPVFQQDRCYFPVWSPKGNKIAFIRAKDEYGKVCIIEKVQGERQWGVSYESPYGGLNDQHLTWSLNGDRLMIVSEDIASGETNIFIRKIKDGKRKKIDNTVGAEYPKWISNDEIVFFKGRSIWKTNMRTEESKEIVQNVKHVAGGPCWIDKDNLLYINNGIYDGKESPLVKLTGSSKELLKITMRSDKKVINKALRNGKYLLWNNKHNFLIAVGVLHDYGNFLYVIRE